MCLWKAGKFIFYVVLAASTVSLASSQGQTPPSETKSIVTVTVTDRKHHPVIDLKPEDFALFENGQSRQIDSVSTGVPACIGLLVDMSGSMRSKLPGVVAALLDFVRAGQRDDRVFVVNFNDEPYLDQDFTSNINLVEEALRRANARGGTALYDTLIASDGHFAKAPDCRKRVLVVVSDGADNESAQSLAQTITTLQNSQRSLVYAIGLGEEDPSSRRPGPRRPLESLTAATGGRLFSVRGGYGSGAALRQVAEEIASQYTISYVRSQNAFGSAVPKLQIEVHASGNKDLIIRASLPVLADRPRANQPVVDANQPAGDGKQPALAAKAVASGPPPLLASCIAGSVVDEEGQGLPGITVEVLPTFSTTSYPRNGFPSAVSDEKGEFTIRELEAGRYILNTQNESAGYPPTKVQFYRNFPPNYGQAAETCPKVVIKAGVRAARVRINAVDPATGAPVSPFTASLQSAKRGNLSVARLDRAREILVPADLELTITVWAPRYSRSDPVAVTVSGPGTVQDVTISLGRPGPRP